MGRVSPVRLLVLLMAAASMAMAGQIQARYVSVPAWIAKGNCTSKPRFEPTLNGKPATVEKLLGPKSPQIILVVFDITGSVSRINAAKQAIIHNISKLPRTTWVGLMRSQDGLHVLADPTEHHRKLDKDIQALTSNGNPELLQTVRSAMAVADAIVRKHPVRVSVLYITDGSIRAYREDYTDPIINPSDPNDLSRRFPEALIDAKISKLERQLSSLQAPLFVVHLHYRSNDLDQAYQNGLVTLARMTGGETNLCRTLSDVPQEIDDTFARIENSWRLDLEVPAKANHHVQIGLNASCGKEESLELSWRSRIHLKEE